MASKLVTVFGGSGFLGRRIVEHLAAAGHDVRVGVRHPDRAAFLRRLDRDGRIELVQADVWDEATVTRAVDGAASVINTVGHYVEKARHHVGPRIAGHAVRGGAGSCSVGIAPTLSVVTRKVGPTRGRMSGSNSGAVSRPSAGAGVGDLVDRGPHSAEALVWLENRFEAVVMGNHERPLLYWFDPHRRPSSARRPEWLRCVPRTQHRRWRAALARMPIAVTIETTYGVVGLVHADVPHPDWTVATAILEAGAPDHVDTCAAWSRCARG